MKSKKHLLALFAAIVTIISVIGLVACGNEGGTTKAAYVVTVDDSKSLVLEVGDTVDFKQYFTVTDKNGNQLVVTDSMLDTSKVDTTKAGQFTVTLTVGDVTKTLTFTVSENDDGGEDGGDDDGDDLATVLAKYSDSAKWNFATALTYTYDGATYDEYYEYKGNDIQYVYDDDGEYTDYISYVPSADKFYYYSEQTDGEYAKYEEGTDDFDDWFWYATYVELSEIKDFEFTENNGVYSANKPNDVGNSVIGEYTGTTWTSFTLTIKNGNLATIAAVMSDGNTYNYVFSKFGSVSFTLPGGETSEQKPTEPIGVMDKQTYNANTFDNERLQDKLTKTGKYPDPAIGLPSIGTYNALVIPVRFTNTTISDEQLTNLNTAFNGDSTGTGWESVKSYYYKASYHKLNLSFDIAGYNMGEDIGYYTAQYSSSYYEGLTETDEDGTYHVGDNKLLNEALAYYEDKLDLTDYDYNDDGAIDAVYLIYSAPIEYESDEDDPFFWAYVSWDDDDAKTKYDGLDAYYYLFAGLDFMIEGVQGGYTSEYYPVISGMKVNASTYIHETGHLLGLDDYYDYDERKGSNEGLGGADMMDATVGDQNVYSKLMLGWLTPQIVTTTQTITIKSSQERGDAILIPLNFDNSYFCEYLLIDLYSAQGLNALHASVDNSYLYDGAACGVRIYHVSSSIDNAYDNDYGSFTDNNNTSSDIALIKLVEADGHTKFSDSNGFATDSDLWQAGDKLSEVFPKFMTNEYKSLIFDITIKSVSDTEATITITYNA